MKESTKAYNAINGTNKTDSELEREKGPSLEEVVSAAEKSEVKQDNGYDITKKSETEWWDSFNTKQNKLAKTKKLNKQYSVTESGQIRMRHGFKVKTITKKTIQYLICFPLIAYFGIIYPYVVSENKSENMSGSIDFLTKQYQTHVESTANNVVDHAKKEYGKIVVDTDELTQGDQIILNKDVKNFKEKYNTGTGSEDKNKSF